MKEKGMAALIAILLIAAEIVALIIGSYNVLGEIAEDWALHTYDTSGFTREDFSTGRWRDSRTRIEKIRDFLMIGIFKMEVEDRTGKDTAAENVEQFFSEEIDGTQEAKYDRWLQESERYILDELKEQYGVDGVDIDWRQINYNDSFEFPEGKYIYFDQRRFIGKMDWQVHSNFIEKTGLAPNLWFDLYDYYYDSSITDVELCTAFFQGAQYYAQKYENDEFMSESEEKVEYITVPNLIGLSFVEAVELLSELGLNTGIPSYDDSDYYARDTVIDQSIQFGTLVEADTMVNLTLSRGGNTSSANGQHDTFDDNLYVVEEESDKEVVVTPDTFGSNSSIFTVQIGYNVVNIEDGSFSNLVNLKEIIVDDRNPYYASYLGILYNKDFTQLICVPRAMEKVQIRNSITSYTEHALDGLSAERKAKVAAMVG